MTDPAPPVPGGPRHVTVSGDLGSGKSSVAAELSEVLGFPVVSTGSLQREIASSLRMSTLEANLHAETDWSIDDRIDGMTVRVAAEAQDGIIFDSRMAWHFVPGALKVRLTVDPYVAAERVVGRGVAAAEFYGSVDEAFAAIGERSASEGRRFQAIYGVDVSCLANFDLVLDTSAVSVRAAAALIAEAYARPPGPRRVLVCPATVVPAFNLADDAVPQPPAPTPPIAVIHARPFFLAVRGEAELAAAIAAGVDLVEVAVLAEGEDRLLGGGTPSSVLLKAGAGPQLARWEAASGVELRGLRHYLAAAGARPPDVVE